MECGGQKHQKPSLFYGTEREVGGMKIKTRESLRTIKTFDRAETLASKTKGGISELHRGAEETQESGYESGTAYAGNQVQGAEEKGTRNTIYGAKRVGKWGVRETKRNFYHWRNRKKKEHLPKSKALPSPERQLLSAPKTAEKTAKTAQKTAKATVKASRRAAQAAKAAAKATVHGIKVAVKATVAAVKATVAAVKGIIAAIAAGGWIAVVIIVVICIIAMAVGAVFSIFTPGKGDLSLNQVIFETENEYAEQLEVYKSNIPHDYVKIRGEPTAWKEVLAVYMVKYKIDGEDREDVTSFTKKQAGKLKQVYRDFNTVLVTLEERTEPYTHLVQNENGEWVEVTEDRTVTDLVFTYHTATVDEIMDKYKFNKRKRQALQDLFRPDFDVLWNALFIESP